jgi:PPOX class probable F420-dependent enzyme
VTSPLTGPVIGPAAAVTLDRRARGLLEQPVVAHLATLNTRGSPRVEPVWFVLEGDRVVITTDYKTVKAANIRRDPRVGLSAISPRYPLDHVALRGRVVETREDDDLVFLDALSHRYTGAPYPRRRWSRRQVYVIQLDWIRVSIAHDPDA